VLYVYIYILVGGDPHFMVKVRGLELPICFNINAHDGDVLRILEDPISGK
jgi:hypothetical protein